MEPVYSTSATASGGRRDGRVRSATLDLAIDPPGHGSATNPEELFAAGCSACFANAAIVVARKLKLVPSGLEVRRTSRSAASRTRRSGSPSSCA